MTVRAALHGATAEHRRDLEVLLGHVLGKSRAWLYSHAEDALPKSARERFAQLRSRLERGEPLAYLTGERDFWGLTLAVNPNVLIPRPDSELLVELALNRMRRGAAVVDLGTGSGAIAVALAYERPDCSVTATDVSAAALATARANAQRHSLAIDFIERDWFEGLGRFDLVVSNPPYVRIDDPHLPALKFEPAAALVSGPLGLDAIRCITAAAPDHLTTGGHLIVEHGYDQGAAVRDLFRVSGFTGVATFSDLGGRERATLGER